MKEETIEEAAEKQWGKLAIINDRAAVIAFKAGAKWQAEKMYSEEEVLKLLITFSDDRTFLKKNVAVKWFEQFKKGM
jgi:hypothetical protein